MKSVMHIFVMFLKEGDFKELPRHRQEDGIELDTGWRGGVVSNPVDDSCEYELSAFQKLICHTELAHLYHIQIVT